MIQIITIEREYGCGAGAIAKALAERLGWTLWDREITCEIAKRLKCDVKKVEQREERLDPAYYRLMKIFMRGSYEESFTGSGLEMLDAEHLARLFEHVAVNIASQGKCVIVGRGAPWFLRDRPDVFHTFLYAPHEEKLRRLAANGTSASEAEHLLGTVDRERAAFVKRFFGRIWPQRDLYHMMINTIFGDEVVIDMILNGVRVLDHQGAEAVRA